MGINVSVYMDVCVWVCVCFRVWEAKEKILSSAFLTGVRISKRKFVYFGAKTTQRAVLAKTCEIREKDEGR